MTKATPLSEFLPEHSMREFVDSLLYGDEPGKEDRFAGDMALLDQLDRELFDHSLRDANGRPVRRFAQVKDLDHTVVRSTVGRVERSLLGIWRLDVDDSEPSILKRLDRHFAGPQRNLLAERRAQDERAQRYVREAAMLDAEVAGRNARQERELWGLPAA